MKCTMYPITGSALGTNTTNCEMPLYIDNSFKWAGGGFLSNVKDPVKFGNAMLYSFEKSENSIEYVQCRNE